MTVTMNPNKIKLTKKEISFWEKVGKKIDKGTKDFSKIYPNKIQDPIPAGLWAGSEVDQNSFNDYIGIRDYNAIHYRGRSSLNYYFDNLMNESLFNTPVDYSLICHDDSINKHRDVLTDFGFKKIISKILPLDNYNERSERNFVIVIKKNKYIYEPVDKIYIKMILILLKDLCTLKIEKNEQVNVIDNSTNNYIEINYVVSSSRYHFPITIVLVNEIEDFRFSFDLMYEDPTSIKDKKKFIDDTIGNYDIDILINKIKSGIKFNNFDYLYMASNYFKNNIIYIYDRVKDSNNNIYLDYFLNLYNNLKVKNKSKYNILL